MSELKKLIIVGAGDMGRELLQWCKEINAAQQKWEIVGFIDDDVSALDPYACDYPIIGAISDYEPSSNEVFALGIAGPAAKERVVETLKAKGAKFTQVIHPRALLSDYTNVGEGVVMYPNVIMGPNTTVGNFATLLSGGGHDVVIGDYSTVSSLCDLCGHVEIGRKAFIASHVSVIPGKKIGDEAYVGAGSIVIRNVKAGARVFGNPARQI